MDSLLQIASSVEAAVASYVSVQPVPVADMVEWKRHFTNEFVSAAFS
jgi:hypothetical protein